MTLAGTKGVPRAVREQQIIDVATAEFAERGYANASLVDIAATAGISKPLIYTYFGSRDGLHAACVQRAGEQLVEAVTAAQQVQGGPPARSGDIDSDRRGARRRYREMAGTLRFLPAQAECRT